MDKNKLIALGLAVIAFIAFYWGFMDFEQGAPMSNLMAFIVVIGSTCASIAVGNSGER